MITFVVFTGLLTTASRIMKIQNCYRSLEITTNPRVMVEQFCKSILQIETENSKALTNLVMGLGSQRDAGSVVATSLSPCYHYQYSSISKSIKALDKQKTEDPGKGAGSLNRQEVEKKFALEGGLFFKTL